MVASELEQILERINNKNLPPVHLWNPPLSGEMDMRIAADGSWFYQGSKIERQPMVKLFSTILKRESDDYFLITPVEKYKIQVDDAPFVAVEVDKVLSDTQTLLFRTNVDDEILAGVDHQIHVNTDLVTSQPRPYLHIREGLYALIHRNVFYQLVEWAQEQKKDGTTALIIQSQGQQFELGRL